MKLKFRNKRNSTIWIAVMIYNPAACSNHGFWQTMGWWSVAPGGTVYPCNTTNRYACFYAESEDGFFWAGGYGPVYIYYDAFDSCVGIGSTAAYDMVGMRLTDLGTGAGSASATHYVNLI